MYDAFINKNIYIYIYIHIYMYDAFINKKCLCILVDLVFIANHLSHLFNNTVTL